MVEAPRILLEHHLKRLKLPTFLREYEKLARQCAAEGLNHVQFLARLVELELIDRERRLVERPIKQAGFPARPNPYRQGLPPMGRRGVFPGVGRDLRQRCARERWSLIEFACVSLTEEIGTYKLSIKSVV